MGIRRLSEAEINNYIAALEGIGNGETGVITAIRIYDQLYADGYNYAGWAVDVAHGDTIARHTAFSFDFIDC
jgi:hypothetical protein